MYVALMEPAVTYRAVSFAEADSTDLSEKYEIPQPGPPTSPNCQALSLQRVKVKAVLRPLVCEMAMTLLACRVNGIAVYRKSTGRYPLKP